MKPTHDWTPAASQLLDEESHGELRACVARVVADHLAEWLDADTLDALTVELAARSDRRANAPVEYWPTC